MSQLQTTTLVILALPFLQYQIWSERGQNSEGAMDFMLFQSLIYHNMTPEFLSHVSEKSSGFEAVNAAFQLMVRSGDMSRGNEFLELLEEQLGVKVPGTFAGLFRNGKLTSINGLEPGENTLPTISGEQVFRTEHESSEFKITIPESQEDGRIQKWLEGQLIWETKIWRAHGGIGASYPDTVFFEAVLSNDCSSIFTFSVQKNEMCIFQFDVNTGDQVGAFMTLPLFSKDELDQ